MAELSAEQRRRLDDGIADLLTRYPDDQKGAALLEVLHVVQEIVGWVPESVMPLVAEKLEIPVVRVREVASFYLMYLLERPGKHLLEVCTNPSCSVRGGDEILRRACERYKVKPGHTSADGKVTLEVVECMGSCGTAPMVALDREYRENLTRTTLEQLFAEIERD